MLTSMTPNPTRRVRRVISAPFRRYLDSRFDRVEERLDRLEKRIHPTSSDFLARVDVSAHNAGAVPPTFERVVSQVVSAAQFLEPDFERNLKLLYPSQVRLPWGGAPGVALHRKVWEFVYIVRAAEQYGLLKEGRRAVGFGVGREPVPAALARQGLSVLATDLHTSNAESASWASTWQHLSGIDALSHPDIVSDEVLQQAVTIRYVDMTAIPDDLGSFDFVWSCGALEHLGSPEAGLDFVSRSLGLLSPGGVAAHTTELELTRRTTTADYGDIVVYQLDDLDRFAGRART